MENFLNVRKFYSTIWLIILLSVCTGFSQNFDSKHFTIEKLGDGIYAAIHKTGGYAICNAGIVNLGDETLIFDCFISPEAARDLKKAAEQLTGNPIKYVINSHFHNDHIRGNQVFSNSIIISTEITKKLIEKYEPEEIEYEKKVVDKRIDTTLRQIELEKDIKKLEEQKMWLGYYKAIKESFSEYKITPPNLTISDSLTLYGKKRKAILFTKGKAHTESDLVLWLPDDKVLFTGDVLSVHRHPWLGDGSVGNWIDYLRKLEKLDAQKIVPGHGPVGTMKDINPMIDYLTTIDKIVDNAITKNVSEDELGNTSIPDKFKDWWFGKFFIPNVINLYELKTGKSESN